MDDILHTIREWYDGPRTGATTHGGEHYWYRSVYLDSEIWDADEDRYELTHLSDEALEWELEITRIFDRWDLARKNGSVIWIEGDDTSFGALPEEMQNYLDLNQKLDTYIAETKPTILARGNFVAGTKKVCWERIDSPGYEFYSLNKKSGIK